MAEEYPDWRRAQGRIQIGVRRLATDYPFHTKILERFRVTANPTVGTMGVTASEDGVILLHDPSFVLSLSLDELAGVLLHEVHHVLFHHITADPADFPDRWARIIAEEVTANEFVTLPLPGNGIRLEQFPELRPMQSTRERYRRLRSRRTRIQISAPQGQLIIARTSGSTGGKTSASDQYDTSARHGQLVVLVDNHEVWKQTGADRRRSEAAVEMLIQDAIIEVGPDRVPEELREAVRDLVIGHMPGTGAHVLGPTGCGHLDWRLLLRRYVGQYVEVRPVFTRPPRRFPNLVGIVPGRNRRSGRPKILAVIDTSGSITPVLLDMINAELARLARDHVVTVVECDAQIHAVYPFKPLRKVVGRGGTDLRPPFTSALLREHRPDVVVYFTDGFGPAPQHAPPIPVIWCLTPSGRQPADWGRAVHMYVRNPA